MNFIKPEKSVFQLLHFAPGFKKSPEYKFLCDRIGKPIIPSLIKLKLDEFLRRINCLFIGKNTFYKKLPSKGRAYYSQKREELIIRSFFRDRKKGVFIDVGCAWPFQLNTTCYLEQHLDWTGLAVDADPKNLRGWKKVRKNTQLFTYIISDHSDTVENFYKAGGLGSIKKEYRFKDKIIQGKEIQVPTITLTKLLEENKITKIDFLSIDIEGSEMKALSGFDIERFQPKLVCIEFNRSLRSEILAYFESHQYKMLTQYEQFDILNRYFVPHTK